MQHDGPALRRRAAPESGDRDTVLPSSVRSETSPLECFGGDFNFSWSATNRYFFDGWWKLSKTGIGLITGGAMARQLGTHTLFQALPIQHGLGGFSIGGGSGLGFGASAISVGMTAIANGIASTAALEAGITVGAFADALGQTLAGYCR
jgi:hypothetical protein